MSERFKLRAAVYLIPRKDDKVLLSLRHNTGWMDGMYSLVAGHVEAGETLEEAMIREANEETTIDITAQQLKFVHLMQRIKDQAEDEYVDVFFEVREWSGEFVNNEPEKCGGLEWFPVTALPENTLDYIKDVVTNYEQGASFSVLRNMA
jgi:8-oxo-dGTP diphosphatase